MVGAMILILYYITLALVYMYAHVGWANSHTWSFLYGSKDKQEKWLNYIVSWILLMGSMSVWIIVIHWLLTYSVYMFIKNKIMSELGCY